MSQSQAAVREMPEPLEAEGEEKSREQSKIAFPYLSLIDGIEIAMAIHQLHGTSATLEQIAAHIGSTPTSGTFRAKMSTAKVFTLITYSQGAANLTSLGSRICDPQQKKLARVDAFLAVPLYKAVHEKFKGMTLPPAAGLEAALVSLGVTTKQKERARQVLQRSAQEAGFFQFGTDLLVMPAIKASAAPVIAPQAEPEPDKKKKSKDEDDEELDPFISRLTEKTACAPWETKY